MCMVVLSTGVCSIGGGGVAMYCTCIQYSDVVYVCGCVVFCSTRVWGVLGGLLLCMAHVLL